MAKIENQAQYEWAVKRVEELLPLVTDETPATDANSITSFALDIVKEQRLRAA